MTSAEELTHATNLISAPTAILCKRPKSSHISKRPNPAQQAWYRFEHSVHAQLESLYESPLSDLSRIVNHFPHGREIVTVCVAMGAAAAAGDREQAFRRVFSHVAKEPNTQLVSLFASSHATVRAILQQLSTIDFSRKAIIAIDDADRFQESVLRDLIYVCAKKRASHSAIRLADHHLPPLTLVLGVGVSDSRFHSTLGIEEASTILPTLIHMPTAVDSFRQLITALDKTGLLFTKQLFQLLCNQFIHQERTIAMIMRSLRILFTLHFFREPLAVFFCSAFLQQPHPNENLSGERDRESSQEELQHLYKEIVKEARERKDAAVDIRSVPSQDEIRSTCLSSHRQLCRWRSRVFLLRRLAIAVFRLLNIRPRMDSENEIQVKEITDDLYINVFKFFLVESASRAEINIDFLMTPLFEQAQKAGRPTLCKLVKTIKDITIQYLQFSQDEEIDELLEKLKKLETDLHKITEQGTPPSTKTSLRSTAQKSPYARGGGAAKRRRRQLMLSVADEVQSSDPLILVRKKFAATLKDLANLNVPLNEIPLHEAILVSNTTDVETYSGSIGRPAEPRTSLLTAMRQPSKVLGPISSKRHPDITVAYQILAEGGRLVSLYDWYNNFASITTASRAVRDDEGKVRIININATELQARFARACSELEFLGVMKYTNRKADHVARLLFE